MELKKVACDFTALDLVLDFAKIKDGKCVKCEYHVCNHDKVTVQYNGFTPSLCNRMCWKYQHDQENKTECKRCKRAEEKHPSCFRTTCVSPIIYIQNKETNCEYCGSPADNHPKPTEISCSRFISFSHQVTTEENCMFCGSLESDHLPATSKKSISTLDPKQCLYFKGSFEQKLNDWMPCKCGVSYSSHQEYTATHIKTVVLPQIFKKTPPFATRPCSRKMPSLNYEKISLGDSDICSTCGFYGIEHARHPATFGQYLQLPVTIQFPPLLVRGVQMSFQPRIVKISHVRELYYEVERQLSKMDIRKKFHLFQIDPECQDKQILKLFDLMDNKHVKPTTTDYFPGLLCDYETRKCNTFFGHTDDRSAYLDKVWVIVTDKDPEKCVVM